MLRILFFFICLVLGLYRIDFSEWKGSFQITPILILSSIFVISYSLFLIMNFRKIEFPKYLPTLIIFIILYVSWCLIGIDYSDPIQTKRIVLLTFLFYFGFLINIYIYNSDNPRHLLSSFVLFSIVIYSLMSGFQYYFFLFKVVHIKGIQFLPWLELYSFAIDLNWPRLNGGFLDPNIAGYYLIFLYISINILEVSGYRKYTFYKYLLFFLVLFTLSRSAIVTFLIISFLIVIVKGDLHKVLKPTIIKIIITMSILIIGVFALENLESSGKLDTLINKRLTVNDKSASIHFGLIEHGINKILEEPITFIKGYGFGSSYILTGDFFKSKKYGNFHSEFLTIQLETGIFGLFLYLLILLFPFVILVMINMEKKYLWTISLLIIALFLENIFYQQFLFHYYWLFVFIPWFWMDKKFIEKFKSK